MLAFSKGLWREFGRSGESLLGRRGELRRAGLTEGTLRGAPLRPIRDDQGCDMGSRATLRSRLLQARDLAVGEL